MPTLDLTLLTGVPGADAIAPRGDRAQLAAQGEADFEINRDRAWCIREQPTDFGATAAGPPQ
jgi:hypothetical protein